MLPSAYPEDRIFISDGQGSSPKGLRGEFRCVALDLPGLDPTAGVLVPARDHARLAAALVDKLEL